MNRLLFVNYVDVFLKKIKPQQKKIEHERLAHDQSWAI